MGDDHEPQSGWTLYQPDHYVAEHGGDAGVLSQTVRRKHSAAVLSLFDGSESGSVTMTNFEERVLRDLGELKAHMRWIVGNGNEGKIQELEMQNPEARSGAATHRRARRGGGNPADHHASGAGFAEGDTSLMTKQEFVQQAYAAASRSSERSGMPAHGDRGPGCAGEQLGPVEAFTRGKQLFRNQGARQSPAHSDEYG